MSASKTSATETTRPACGMASLREAVRVAGLRPSARDGSGRCAPPVAGSASGCCPRIPRPCAVVCDCMTRNSADVSLSGALRRIMSEIAILADRRAGRGGRLEQLHRRRSGRGPRPASARPPERSRVVVGPSSRYSATSARRSSTSKRLASSSRVRARTASSRCLFCSSRPRLEVARLQVVAHPQQHLVVVKRLGDEVPRARLQRTSARLDRDVARQHDHGGPEPCVDARPERFQQRSRFISGIVQRSSSNRSGVRRAHCRSASPGWSSSRRP